MFKLKIDFHIFTVHIELLAFSPRGRSAIAATTAKQRCRRRINFFYHDNIKAHFCKLDVAEL